MLEFAFNCYLFIALMLFGVFVFFDPKCDKYDLGGFALAALLWPLFAVLAVYAWVVPVGTGRG